MYLKVVDSMFNMLNKLNEVELKNKDFLTISGYYVFIFLLGSVAGFIYEELFYLLIDGVIKKCGFLYGFYLPVYGFGAVFMAFLLKRFKKNPLVVFFLAMIVTGVVEYITGVVLFSVYHKTWWDYSGLLLNIGGYVCLRSVLSFAVGGLLLIYVAEPLVVRLINYFKKNTLIYSMVFIIFIFLFDFILTLLFRNAL